jgi:hypothetical protein
MPLTLTPDELKALEIFGQDLLNLAEPEAKTVVLDLAPKFTQLIINYDTKHPGILGWKKGLGNDLDKLIADAYVWAGGDATKLPTTAN